MINIYQSEEYRRALNYALTFPDRPSLQVSQTAAGTFRIEGMWIMGNNYTTKSTLYGAYPYGYLQRILAMFPEHETLRILHLCSGSVSKGNWVTVDINETRSPDIVADAHQLPFKHGVFDLCLIDTPYSVEDCDHYGTPMVRRNTIMTQLHPVMASGGWVIFLDQVLPQYSKEVWHLGILIGMVKSTNHRFRVVTGFQRRGSSCSS